MSTDKVETPKSSKRKTIFLIVTVILLLAAGLAGWEIYTHYRHKTASLSTKQSANKQSNAPTKLSKPPTGEHFGFVQGTPSFPGGTVPADEQVCAENIDTHKTTCVKVTKIPNGPYIYGLGLPVGNYNIYAIAPAETHKYRAYYNQYVICGAKPSCPATSHKDYVKVSITDGSKSSDYNPNDWDDPSQAK